MDWFVVFLVAGAGIAVWRIVYQLRRAAAVKVDDWDTRLIERLRRSGADPFQPVEVDFFVAMPTREQAEQLATQLNADGYVADVRDLPDSADLPFSVHAQRTLQLNVEAIRSTSGRLRELAAAGGGRYDGWAPGPPKASA